MSSRRFSSASVTRKNGGGWRKTQEKEHASFVSCLFPMHACLRPLAASFQIWHGTPGTDIGA